MIRLSGISGTKATVTIALIMLLDKDRFQISPAGMSKLGLTEGSRIDVGANPDDGNALYIAMVNNKNEGRNVSKTGKVQSEQIHSWLVDNPKGLEGRFEILDTTIEHDGIVWHKLAIFDAPATSVAAVDVATPIDETANDSAGVSEESNEDESAEEPVRAEVGAEEEVNEESEEAEEAPTADVEDTENF